MENKKLSQDGFKADRRLDVLAQNQRESTKSYRQEVFSNNFQKKAKNNENYLKKRKQQK
jgi:hypothetical protein